MKKTIFLMMLLAISSLSANAQILKNQKKRAEQRAKQRAENKAQNKVDRKVDEAVDDAFNKIGGLFKKKKKNQEVPESEEEVDYENENAENEAASEEFLGNFSSMMGGKSPADLGLPNTYVFETYVETELTSTNKKGKEETALFNYLLPEEEGYMGYEVEDQAIGIMDMNRKKIVSVIKAQNMATVMDMESIADMAEDYTAETTTQADIDQMKITKTGQTKMIAGYKCEQYLIDSKETSGEMWKALDFDKMDLMKMGAGMSQMMQQNKKLKVPEEYLEFMQSGFMFEGTFVDKERNEKSKMVVLSVASKKTAIDLQQYKIMDMSKFMKKR